MYPLTVLGTDLSYLPGDLGDARFINYILEHGYQCIAGIQESFYNAPFFYPSPMTTALSDNMAGNIPIYSVYRFLNFSRENSLQLWWLSIFALNYFISYVCFYKYSRHLLASAIVSYLFSFCIINLSQLGYIQINTKFMLPVIIVSYLLWLKNGALKYFYVFLIALFLQLLLGIYYTTFAVLFVAVITIIHFITNKTFSPFKNLLNLKQNKGPLASMILIGVLSYLYLLPYFKLSVSLGKKYENVINIIPKLQTLISAHPSSLWKDIVGFGDHYFPDLFWLHQYFPGIFPFLVLLAVFVLFLFRRKWLIDNNMKTVLFSFIVLLFISIRWNDTFSPLQILYKIKLFSGITYASRILIVLDVIMLLVTLSLLRKILNFKSMALNFGLFAFLLIFAVIDNYFDSSDLARIKKQDILIRYEKLERAIPKESLEHKKILAIVQEDLSINDKTFILDAMLFSQAHNLKCINGYSSNSPETSSHFWGYPTRAELDKRCKTSGIDTVSVIIVDSPGYLK